MAADPAPRWHAALAYALLGPPIRELPEPATPQIPRLIADLGGVEAVRSAAQLAKAGGDWPFRLPPELRDGLGPAQLAAATAVLVAAIQPLNASGRPVLADRSLSADESRLLADRPPHHGS